MKKFFAPNLTRAGRMARMGFGLILLIAGAIAFASIRWLGVVLFGASAFAFFEALRGWCVLRACGIRTKL